MRHQEYKKRLAILWLSIVLGLLISVTAVQAELVANFAATPTEGGVPLSVSFTDESEGGGWPWNILAWGWDFGDGGTSKEKDPEHTYTKTGIYKVTLLVVNLAGTDIEEKLNYIRVWGVPIADFSAKTTDLSLPTSPKSLVRTEAIYSPFEKGAGGICSTEIPLNPPLPKGEACLSTCFCFPRFPIVFEMWVMHRP